MQAFGVLAVSLIFIQLASGAAFFDAIKEEIVFGKTVKYCEYKGLRLLPRSSIKDYDTCAMCTCKKDGLACFTMYGLIAEPTDSPCTYIIVNCKVKWVLRSDKNKRCPRKLIPGNSQA